MPGLADRPSALALHNGDPNLHVIQVAVRTAMSIHCCATIATVGGTWPRAASSTTLRPVSTRIRQPKHPRFRADRYDSGVWHSWVCLGGLVDEVAEATGIRPGALGLIQAGEEAFVAANFLNRSA